MRTATRRGFTLIETALAIVVIGVGVLALLAAQVAFHQQNRWSTHASRAMFLANELRETMMHLPRHDPVTGHDAAATVDPATGYDPETGLSPWGPELNEFDAGDWDDVDDFDGAEFSGPLGNGPIDASRRVVPGLDGWIQRVRVFHVDPFDLDEERPRFSTDLVQVEVVVLYQAPGAGEPEELTRLNWLAP
ncbi:MAG: type IV pilus modification PilV family protein [Phycisphaerales bacterium]|jgi:prepilin-type N-terminal cleavage/methylation domain-containing protein|nr:prepilin-type N-terminal cleavage/methylation domain-containing protein [Planctomycetota bacterium]